MEKTRSTQAVAAPAVPEQPQTGRTRTFPGKFLKDFAARVFAEEARDKSLSGSSRVLGPLLFALGATLVLLTIPRLPLGTDLDSSWSAVLGYAHQHGLQFGTDIVFTYGPLGFLTSFYFSQTPVLRVIVDGLLCFCVAAGVGFCAWRVRSPWRWFLLVTFVFFAANAEPRTDLLVDLGLLGWGLLCLCESGPRLGRCLAVLGGLAVFAALTKIPFLFAAGLTVAAVGCDLLARRRWQPAAALLVAVCGAFVVAWVVLGQSLLNLIPYLRHAFAISAGYDRAMGIDPYPQLGLPALVMTLAAGVSVVLRALSRGADANATPRLGRAVVLCWSAALLFMAWKHGQVRCERDHLEVLLGFVPMLVLALEVVPSAGGVLVRASARTLALICCLVSAVILCLLFSGNVGGRLARPFRLAAQNAARLCNPRSYLRQMRQFEQAEQAETSLPRSRERLRGGSVDVFGNDQSYAVLNGLRYRPRPVFQSYAAYSRELMQLNEKAYRPGRAPEYVLFKLNTIDDRYPPLEDAPLLPLLLANYTPIDLEGPFLVLRSRKATEMRRTLLRETTVAPGQQIDLQEFGDSNLWLEADLQPSLLGRVRQFLYQPPVVALAVWCRAPTLRVGRFHAPAPMLAAGFLASPLQLDNSDVLDLYTGKPVTRATAYAVEPAPGTERFWQDRVHVRIYRVENPLGNCASPELARLAKFPGFEVAPTDVASVISSVVEVGGKPALQLPPGGYLRFTLPPGVKTIVGQYGFAPAAYLLGGATPGAEFRIEQELPDGSRRLLASHTLRPSSNHEDRGMKPFAVDCPGTGARKILLGAVPTPEGPSRWDYTCWAGIGFR